MTASVTVEVKPNKVPPMHEYYEFGKGLTDLFIDNRPYGPILQLKIPIAQGEMHGEKKAETMMCGCDRAFRCPHCGRII